MSRPRGFSVFLAPLAGYCCGVALSAALYPRISPLAGAALAAIALAGTATTLKRRAGELVALVLLAVAFAFLGLFAGLLRLEGMHESRLTGIAGEKVTLEGTIIERPRYRDTRIDLFVSAERVTRSGQAAVAEEDILVSIFCREDCAALAAAGLAEGRRLRLTGAIGKPESSPGADFDYGQYLRRRGVHATMAVDIGGLELLNESRGGWRGAVDRLREYSRESLDSGAGAASSLVQGMVLGDDSQVPRQVTEDFRDAGLLHLLAVSGQNVMLLAMVAMALCRLLFMPRPASAAIAALVVLVYVPLTGAGPSIVRAGIVGIMGLTAMVISRQSDRYHFLLLAAAAILTINPWSIADPGFQLSFSAVLGIFLVVPPLAGQLGFLPAYVREAVAIAIAAGLTTAPVTLYHFEQVSLVSVPANVAAAPVAGLVMFLGTIAILAGALLPALAWLLALAAAACCGYLIVAAALFASLPAAVYSGREPGMVEIVIFYGMLLAMVIVMKKRSRPANGQGRWRILLLLLALMVLPAGLASDCDGRDNAGTPPKVFTASVLDVGQGDAILLQEPGGATVLVDGGPGEEVTKRLAESGVSRLDAVVLSHPHADHVAGLKAVLDEYEVGAVYDAAPPSTSGLYRDFLQLVEQKGIAYHILRQGQTLAIGGLTFRTYSPGDQMDTDDINANSVVMVATYDWLDILLPGDAESDVLNRLDLPPVEVCKVAHHGSRDDGLAELLARIRPDVAVISAGEGNSYGHPAPGTLAKLQEAGARVFRTDQQGTVMVTPAAGGVEVQTRR